MTTRIVTHASHATSALLLAAALSVTAPAQDNLREARYATREGELIVRSGQPGPRPAQARPAFDQLDGNGDGNIDESEARAYITLANDFDYADHDNNHRISRREFDRW